MTKTFTNSRITLLLFAVFYVSALFAQTVVPYSAGQTIAASSQSIRFIENKNQWHPNVEYKLELSDAAMFFEKNAVTYSLLNGTDLEALHEAKHGAVTSGAGAANSQIRAHAFKLHFNNASPSVNISADGVYSDYRNYYIGDNTANWASEVYSYQKLSYSGIYPGIDLKFYASPDAETQENRMKYDFIVHAGSDPSPIQVEYEGLDNIYLKNGNLHLVTSVNTVIEQKPYAYQIISGQEVAVECRYKLNGSQLSFEFPAGYSNRYDLVIDPVLIFSTYTGSTSDNFGFTATYDLQSNLYAGGIVFGIGYPTTLGAFQVGFSGLVDVSITKFNPAGTGLIFSTYLGGIDTEIPSSLVVNSSNELVVLGATSSNNFPTTLTGYDRTFNGGIAVNFTANGADFNFGTDIFVSKFNAAGTSLGGSTFVGGSGNDGINQNSTAQLQYNYGDQFRGEVIVDILNNIYVASSSLSSNFPVTAGVFQPAFAGTQDAIVFKMNTNLSALTWSSYLGGIGVDAGYSLKLDAGNNLFVCGGTTSTNLASTTGALFSTARGGVDGYISKINNTGTVLTRTTYIGTTSYDQTYFVDLDRFNNVYVFGQTRGIYPVTGGVYSNPNTKQFIHKLSNDLNATLFSTTFGFGTTTTNISPTAFLVDVCGHIYASGWGGSVNTSWNSIAGTTSGMPTTAGAFQTTTDGSDFYFIVLGPDASFLEYATFFGGNGSQEHVDGGTSRFDKRGAIYQAVCAGCGANSLFPTTPGVWSNTNNSNNCNLGALKFDFQISAVNVEVQTSPAQGCAPLIVNFSDIGVNATSWLWTFGDGGTSTLENPTHTFINPGTYQVRLIGYDSASCSGVILTDTAFATVVVRSSVTTLRNLSICQGKSLFVGGALRTTPGTYRDTLVASNGCDSIVVTNLTVRPNSASQVNTSICQ
ncbi:MAG: PKD domain-containing protein, partial [Bacteroidota bacterium]